LFDNSPARIAPLTQVRLPKRVMGTSGNFYTEHIAREVRDDLSISSGSHNLTVGAGFLRNGLGGDNRPAPGTWTFSVDQPFNPNQVRYDPTTLTAAGSTLVPLPGSIRQFTASLLPLPVFTPHDLLSEYVQDEWKPGAGVTLNFESATTTSSTHSTRDLGQLEGFPGQPGVAICGHAARHCGHRRRLLKAW
jgi:hypothetical protein